jgi:hypothetical protein
MIYHITSIAWTGYIEAEYNELGYMRRVDLSNAELSEEQQKWFLNRMPRELSELQRVIAGSSAKITDIKKEITFQEMWDRYAYKTGRKEAEAKWNKMPKSEQIKAFDFVPKYLAKKLETVPQLYLASYLNKERWND